VNANELTVREAAAADLARLASFRCSTGEQWEDLVEDQIRGPLPRRYLSVPPNFDGHMLLGCERRGEIRVVGAHHIEPTLVPDVGYTEVVAVARDARGTLVHLPSGEAISLGAFMLLTIFRQMRALGRHPRTFVRVDRRNLRSLALCDRVGLTDERPDPHDAALVQRWGELPV
jgi:hypothetical protein